ENPPPPPPLELLRDRINQEDEYPPVVIGEFYDHRGSSCGIEDSTYSGFTGALFNELSYRTPKNNKTVRKVCDKPPSPPQSLKIMSQRKAKQTAARLAAGATGTSLTSALKQSAEQNDADTSALYNSFDPLTQFSSTN
ncbi:unnamed protein product, partial [Amoebophrya sp. A120]